ncbi:RimJ/RimL family protein N-acetyltransferase [Clostridium acetobutylicum]|uniref:Predicted acetyltransferase n=3 Tax=Clostridium acetobutylicum TaxID=1488 RepID=Q97G60_CLOAB|nr:MULTISPECIES: GNAT family N-acetyltransferase [Clostridium]AAK80463.1 Predicted acetyltransferase [Clostridium acetobutylicum ATCC 824]ADZ21560.1 acetyltransferase [Clostridium acetobutylicum EA 2018]AEI34349.1 acetyltransferase [Clostridium acetobutylicum DSM 1731]AWV79120.1 GNAT family N-acetyltransferase [Clostridium acetobutylicum]KHD38630.1 acetyltransferase [Clostridium acetobutylicum]
MIIREIRPIDADAFWKMQYELDKETKYMMYEPGERVRNLSFIKSLIEEAVEGNDLLLVAEEYGKIIGFISAERGVTRRVRHCAYVVVGVRKEFQGKGIGSKLFRKMNLWAERQKIKRLELTVVCDNEEAKRLYEKNGFSIEGIKKNSMFIDDEYVDEFCMAKLL